MSRLLELADGRWAHASGALWLPSSRTVLVADAHLGYGWAQRRRGELGPVGDRALSDRLHGVLDELSPQGMVFLGDAVHAPRPGVEERRVIGEVLGSLAARTTLVIVRGNHDRGFARDFGEYPLAEEWRGDGLIAVHGDRLPTVRSKHLIIGHFHPVLSPRDAAGAKTRVPVFAWTAEATLLPAFSPFAAGCDLVRHWSGELGAALGSGVVRVAACTGKRVAMLRFERPGD